MRGLHVGVILGQYPPTQTCTIKSKLCTTDPTITTIAMHHGYIAEKRKKLLKAKNKIK